MNPSADLELTITRHDQRAYAMDFCYANSDPGNQADVRLGAKEEQALAVFDVEKLQQLQLLALGEFKEYGAELTASFFKDESLRSAFAQARAIAGQADVSLRMRLTVWTNALELHALCWELLNDPQTGGCLPPIKASSFRATFSVPTGMPSICGHAKNLKLWHSSPHLMGWKYTNLPLWTKLPKRLASTKAWAIYA
jgi:hypothetical protein